MTTSQSKCQKCLYPKALQNSKPHLLEVVGDLKLVLLVGHVGLDLRVGVVDDGQEHVDQHEEDKEDKEHEEDWAKDAVGRLQLLEVKVAQDDTEQGEAARVFESI